MTNLVIIEDNIHFCKALVNIAAELPNIAVQNTYSDAETSIQELVALRPDIVIVDIQLKGKLSGIDVIRKTKPVLINTEFLICSVHDDNNLVFDALRCGASGYILKDSNIEEIKNAITDLLHGGAPMSPYIARQVIHSFRDNSVSTNNTPVLTSREKEILQLLGKGLLYKEIADDLSISHSTVKKHIRNMYEKLHVQNKIEALNKLRFL